MQLTKLCLAFVILLLPFSLQALELGVDGFANANHEETSLYSHSYFFVGGDGFRLGGKRFFELALGRFERQYNDKLGTGTGAVLQTGWLVKDWLSLSIPFVYKKISEGDLVPRTLIDAVPQVGLRWGW